MQAALEAHRARARPATAVGECDLVIEAATENESVKRKIFTDLLPAPEARRDASPPTPRRSRSPGWPPSTDRPEHFIGMHFMNPVPVMQLVELIRGIATEDETFAAATQLRREPRQDRSPSRRTSRPSSSTASCCR